MMYQEPLAWWILSGIITIAMLVIGFFLQNINSRLKEMTDAISKLGEFAARQDEKNQTYSKVIDSHELRINSLEDKHEELQSDINEIKIEHKFHQHKKET